MGPVFRQPLSAIQETPLGDVDFASCERPCKMMDWPMICRIKLTFEVYQTYSSDNECNIMYRRSCGNCPRNSTDCFKKYCITADGFQRGLLTANRQLPGPLIQPKGFINTKRSSLSWKDIISRFRKCKLKPQNKQNHWSQVSFGPKTLMSFNTFNPKKKLAHSNGEVVSWN
uniref:Uncharacterized protein n=1 Tax=Timema bartmani TaxID=61472 RepID=A0A7R9EMJ2_9NEOP|nr:unnamed protein product [Timema bartmani]